MTRKLSQRKRAEAWKAVALKYAEALDEAEGWIGNSHYRNSAEHEAEKMHEAIAAREVE